MIEILFTNDKFEFMYKSEINPEEIRFIFKRNEGEFVEVKSDLSIYDLNKKISIEPKYLIEFLQEKIFFRMIIVNDGLDKNEIYQIEKWNIYDGKFYVRFRKSTDLFNHMFKHQ